MLALFKSDVKLWQIQTARHLCITCFQMTLKKKITILILCRVFPFGGGEGGGPFHQPKICLFPLHLEESFIPPPQRSITPPPPPPLNNNFYVIIFTLQTSSCSQCSCTIFILTSYSWYTLVMLILILIDINYLQKVVFSFEKDLNDQNHSS